MMNFLLAIAVILGSGAGRPVRNDFHEVDLIELNHKYDEETGRHQFDQVIFWRWSPQFRRYDAAGWIIVSEKAGLGGYPVDAGEYYRCRAPIPGGGARVFYAKLFRETVTQRDPERDNGLLNPGRPLRSIVEFE